MDTSPIGNEDTTMPPEDDLFTRATESAYEIGLHVGAERRADRDWWSGWAWGLTFGVLTAVAATVLGRLL